MDSSDLPETHFAQSGDVSIAYQVIGDGPVDLVIVPGIVSHLEAMHDLAGYSDFLRRLSRFSRVAIFDKRGQGLSDRVLGAPTLEERADDVRAVMDALGMTRVALCGNSELFAARAAPLSQASDPATIAAGARALTPSAGRHRGASPHLQNVSTDLDS